VDDNGDGGADRRIAPAVVEGVQAGVEQDQSLLRVILTAAGVTLAVLLALGGLGGAGYWFWRYRRTRQAESSASLGQDDDGPADS
jgi:hypothetical protein